MKIILIITILIAIILLGGSCAEVGIEKLEKPRIKCEEAGGLFYPGGAFAADNCVFPPDSSGATEEWEEWEELEIEEIELIRIKKKGNAKISLS